MRVAFSGARGFKLVALRPHLGNLTRVGSAILHPQGKIAVSLELVNGRLLAEVSLPAGVTGEFVWQGQMRLLVAGNPSFHFEIANTFEFCPELYLPKPPFWLTTKFPNYPEMPQAFTGCQSRLVITL